MPDAPTRSDVLAAYACLPARPAAASADVSNDVIACGDDGLLETARRLGRDLGRPVVGVDTSYGWLPTGSTPSSVLLVAYRHGFSAELARTWVASSLRTDVPLGFLLVDDLDDAEFQAAKLRFAHTRTLPGGDALVDSITGVCGSVDDLVVARPERLSAVLTAPWRLLAIVGHSDLGHLGLGSCLLCGGTGPERYAGRLLADGCDPCSGRCRCTTQFLRTAVPAASLRAAVVALLGCMTFDPTTTESSTTNSLCVGALSGFAVAAVAVLGDFDPHVDAAGQCARAVGAGLSLGAAVQRLNRAHQIPTGHGIALVGDPALILAPPDRTPAETSPWQVAEDCQARAWPLLERCREILRRSRWADRVHRDLLRISVRSMDDGLEDALEVLDRARERVEDAAWTGVELLHEAVNRRLWQEPAHVMSRLDTALGRWDEAFVTAARLVPGNDMFAALHAFHRMDSASTDGSCPQCASGLSVLRFGDPELAGVGRTAVRCWLCGPIQESSVGSAHLAISVEGPLRPGAAVEPRLTIRSPTPHEHRRGRLSVVLHDRLSEEVLSAVRTECTLAALPDVTMTIPDSARSDLQVLWVVWVSDLTVAFAATRVPVTRVDA